jgi:hypothetical protein
MASVRNFGLFPWCYDPEAVDTPNYINFKGTQITELAVPMWWRVKKWSMDVTVNYGGSPPNIATGNFIMDVSESLSGSPQTEADLLCLGSSHTWTFELNITNSPFFQTTLDVDIGPILLWYFESDGATSNLVINPIDTSGQSVSGELKILFLNKQFTTDIYSADNALVSVDSTITAIEYWPYDPQDGGGPIYNSSTGAQIRPFPN